MTGIEFAEKWLRQRGLFDKDSDFDGMIGECVLAIWNVIASQGHSGMSAALVFTYLNAIREDYENPESPIWKEYWETPEGQRIKAEFYTQEPRT